MVENSFFFTVFLYIKGVLRRPLDACSIEWSVATKSAQLHESTAHA